MKTQFINITDKKDRRELREQALKMLKKRQNDFEFYMEEGASLDEHWKTAIFNNVLSDVKQKYKEIGDLEEYGIFSFSPPIYCYVIACVMSDEFMYFYPDKNRELVNCAYTFWSKGNACSFDITKQPWAQWLFNYLKNQKS